MPQERFQSVQKRTGSLVPTGSAFPNRASLPSTCPLVVEHPIARNSTLGARTCPSPLQPSESSSVAGSTLRVAIPLPSSVDVHDPYVFPITDKIVDYEAPQAFRRSGDWLVADLASKAAPAGFSGVLAIGDGRGLQFTAVPGSVPAGGEVLGGPGLKAMLLAVLGAIAGGILLNLMPCVFPILALKALHVSRIAEQGARADALAYGAGAIIGTGALGAVLLAIRAAGAHAGWAFQLQDPRTIMLLLLLAVAITANLLGLFELPVMGGRLQPAGSFGTGALAAFVATPCAGPFLGAALGTALLLPAAGAVAVFAALGLGLALPFLFVAFFPAACTMLPRPGPWMDRLKRFLAIPMWASAAAALWLLYRQTGERGLLTGIVVTIGLLFALFETGRLQRKGKGGAWGGGIAALALAVIAIALVPGRIAPAQLRGGAETWSEARVEGYAQKQRPVFAYFTADWCLTCKVNEAAAIDRSEVRDAFNKAGVKVLVGDWTNGDPAITRFLEGRARAGVPLYLWYAPGKPPEELPQVLTPSMLISRAEAARR